MAVRFNTDHEPPYGVMETLSPLVRRLTCRNPGPFTFRGTGTYVIGRGEVVVVDPGPDNADHITALRDVLDGEHIIGVAITHTHGDHSPGTHLVTSAPTYGFGPHPPLARTAELAAASDRVEDDVERDPSDARSGDRQEEHSDLDFIPDVVMATGDVIDGPGWQLRAIHTPGHISNHLCFELDAERTLLSGDHVMGWSTTVLPAPDGHLGDYLASLRLVQRGEYDTLLPTHGAPISKPTEFVQHLIDHRLDRTAQIIERLRIGDRRIDQLVSSMYPGLDARLVKAAGRSVLAHLIQLEREGSVHAPELPALGTPDRLLHRNDLTADWELV
jgi:glyoxylase-like metal-dependent hydrolase (beta-lactamase superfamily II)